MGAWWNRKYHNIAKDVFNSIHREFESSCFLADVRSSAIVQMQKTLLSDILRDSTLKVSNVDKGAGKEVDRVKPILEACYDMKSVTGIAQLQEKALIRIDGDMIWMHDLIDRRNGCSKLAELHRCVTGGINESPATVQNFSSLTSMDLRGCKSLIELPNFTGIPNLIELKLDDCESLVEVHRSVGFLDKLVTLSLKSCCNLVKLPTEFSLKSLLAMDLSDCTRLEEFPKIIGKMDSLGVLILSFTLVKELHPSIENLIGLNELHLHHCKNLTTLPFISIYGLQNLEILNVSGCSKLVTFPIKASISSHDDSGSLSLPKLHEFKINGCNLSTSDFIGTLDCLETITVLDLSSNNFVSVPTLGKFVNLAN
ncbi:probable disease resistance protein RPP1 [Rosa chinensis]|uniref:probable disease resistance protein RPP1 n=1 Tax=Rosa chinensis TaxID=74649 RepID=UPI000D09315A|nr:probable disease resistance protein RPP1 [Rosa chinensis]